MATVVFNALALRPGGAGISTYIRGLLEELPGQLPGARLLAMVQQDADTELPEAVGAFPVPANDGVRRVVSGLRAPPPGELFHGLNVSLPVGFKGPKVTTLHDMAYFDFPGMVSRGRAITARALWRRSLRSADAIIAVSSFSAERLRARLGLEATVIPEGVGEPFRPPSAAELDAVRQKYDLPPTFVLHVGTIEPRKDVPSLAEACTQAGLPLVLAGARWGSETPINAKLIGYVPTSDLPGLYGAATIVAYPSLYEGFGLPPLEAMACGAAVVASRIPPLVELLGRAALLVPSRDRDALASALTSLSADAEHRDELRSAGLARASQFTWARTAAATADVYKSLGTMSG